MGQYLTLLVLSRILNYHSGVSIAFQGRCVIDNSCHIANTAILTAVYLAATIYKMYQFITFGFSMIPLLQVFFRSVPHRTLHYSETHFIQRWSRILCNVSKLPIYMWTKC